MPRLERSIPELSAALRQMRECLKDAPKRSITPGGPVDSAIRLVRASEAVLMDLLPMREGLPHG